MGRLYAMRIFILMLLSLLTESLGISSSFIPHTSMQTIFGRSLTTESGLPDNNVRCICVDDDGFVWISTIHNPYPPVFYDICDEMGFLLKRYDTSRPSTAAMYPARANGIRRADPGFREKDNIIPPELSRITEIASYNYEYADYPRYKEIDPNLIIFQSEASVDDLVTPFLRMDRDSTVGLCYWGAIEYWGESDGWPKKGWNYSFFDHTLLPYPRAWLVRSCFVDEPQVHIGVLESEQKSIIWNDILSGRAEMSHFYWRPEKGDSITLDNGDHFTDHGFEDSTTPLYRGQALIILRSTRNRGKVKVKVSVPEFKPVSLQLTTN